MHNCTKSDVCDVIRGCIFERQLNMRLTVCVELVGATGFYAREFRDRISAFCRDVRFM